MMVPGGDTLAATEAQSGESSGLQLVTINPVGAVAERRSQSQRILYVTSNKQGSGSERTPNTVSAVWTFLIWIAASEKKRKEKKRKSTPVGVMTGACGTEAARGHVQRTQPRKGGKSPDPKGGPFSEVGNACHTSGKLHVT